MQPTRYIMPRIGGISIGILSAWLLMNLTIAAAVFYRPGIVGAIAIKDPHGPTFPWGIGIVALAVWLTGVIYGFSLSLCWMGTVWQGRWTRLGMRVVIAIVAILLFSGVDFLFNRDSSIRWLRHAVNIPGLMIAQTILFFVMKVVPWSWRSSPLESTDPDSSGTDSSGTARAVRSLQYSISEIILATSCVAFLLTVSKLYVPPVDGRTYWFWNLCVWLVLPFIAFSLINSALNRSLTRSITFLALGLTLTAFTSWGLATVVTLVHSEVSDPSLTMLLYAVLLLGFGMTFVITAIAGRMQSAAVRPAALSDATSEQS